MRTDPDPKLQAAMEEIKAILRKHDITAIVSIESPGAAEFLTHLVATWTCIRLDDCGAIHFTTKDIPQEKRKKVVEDTLGMLLGFLSVIEAQKENVEIMATFLGGQINGTVDHISRRV